ncbi:hypothetical protein [Acinetobacter sp. DSM 11652]|uniref:hypothetical protein n=1 Tax=Acinetobacter sp. DSM 11652 TaxID=346222 RepID=UPI0008C93BA7|nr:hypothetical protein [Acinetobacter sp. DSM 11652]SEL97442.1 hypothetical protein SAMN05216500_108139 [Acinetobacter sp. DSM 11652]
MIIFKIIIIDMEKDWIDYVVALSNTLTPLLVLALTGVGWHIKNNVEKNTDLELKNLERIKELEDKLHVDRIETYNLLLEPFIIMFTSDAIFNSDPKYKGKTKDQLSIGRMLSVDYRKIAFKLSLVADDSVIRAYNALMQHAYSYNKMKDNSPEHVLVQTSVWISLLSEMLLAIRKSMGNASTELDNWEMIEWFMSDSAEMKDLYLSTQTK